MTEFLAENNACGQNLLQIVSVGNSIIAELLRLKDYIPSIYRAETKAEQQKYGEILLDFSYLKIAEAQEKRIEEQATLQELDDEIRENYLELITRFYVAFESTHQYAVDLAHFVNELNRGYYIQQTLEAVLQDAEGKQLMCEALYIYGVILLVLDLHIPGVVRERLLISYYRYSAAKNRTESTIDDVCMLLRSTGYLAAPPGSNSKAKYVPNYPEAYYARYPFDQTFVDMVIGRLRCDDVYNQLAVYPHPDHRSTALSSQAAMLFVCLYFAPKVLHTQVAQMREIVDKFFADNWVISVYMGITINLIDAWDDFKAAKAALQPVVATLTVRGFCLLQRENMSVTLQQTQAVLREGVCGDHYVLQNIGKLLLLMRQCNVLLRWYLTHISPPVLVLSRGIQYAQQVEQLVRVELQYKDNVLFELLLNCSELELVVRETVRNLMLERADRWENCRREALMNINELSAAFAGSRPLAKIESNSQLHGWFGDIAREIEQLNVAQPKTSGRTIIQLIQALEEVQEFHNLQANMQVRQYLLETRDFLDRMIQIINVKEDLLINMQLIGDFSYAWRLIDRDMTPIMQESVKRQPKSVIRLRAAFLKLASALELPLLRLNQAKSEDLISVSNYYSTELANYMRRVLQIIPETMFSLLARIITLQTDELREMPTRLDKDKLKDYAQFAERYTVAKLTHSIAVFTEGTLVMKRTLVGVIELDPKQLLEDGIRKELVRHLANALNVGLIFTAATSSSVKNQPSSVELEQKLAALAKTMDGYRRSFAYIQDYLNVHGLKVLQEELTRIINCNVERECGVFLRNKVQDWQSTYQSVTIPIPAFAPVVGDASCSNNFIGRLASELLRCTAARHTVYLELQATWYERRVPHRELVNARIFGKVREAIGSAGLVGLDRLYSHMLTEQMRRQIEKLQRSLSTDQMWVDALSALNFELQSPQFPGVHAASPLKYYATQQAPWLKVWPTLLDWLLQLGQYQILRQNLAFELSRSSKCNSKHLETALDTFNQSLLEELVDSELQAKLIDHDHGAYSLLADVNEYLLFTGAYAPLEQIYVHTKSSPHMALFLFLFTSAHLSRLAFIETANALVAKNVKDSLDGAPLLFGLITLLQQYNAVVRQLYLAHLCQYVTVLVEANISAKGEIGPEASMALHFLEAFCRISNIRRDALREHIPELVLHQYDYLTASAKN